MRIANNNNNENVSFKSFVTHFQPNMKTPISDAFMQRMTQLIDEFANHPRLHLSIYDVFSCLGNVNGNHKRVIGASVTVQEGYKVPDFNHIKFMVSAPADSDGEEFAKSIRALSTDLEFRYVPDFSSSSNPFSASNPFGEPISKKPPKLSKASRVPVSAPVRF